MSKFTDKHKKAFFLFILVLSFGCVALYHYFTPFLSDDLFYINQLRSASSFADVLRFNVDEYFSNNCRFIDQLLMRLMFYSGNKTFVDIVNSLAFAGLGLLVYCNTASKKKSDIYVIILIFLMMWKYLVDFGDTVLWVAGTAGYLYGILWILGFVTFYRKLLNTEKIKHPVLSVIALVLLGVAAGMSNENTSGGAFLLVLFFTVNKILTNKEHGIRVKNSIRPHMIAAHLSILLGLALLVLGPGARNRKEVVDTSNFTGIVKYASHFYKITASLYEIFAGLFILIIIAIVILAVQKKFASFRDVRNHPGIVFLTAGILVCYAMVVIEPTSDRVYFGASVFFIIAFLNLLQSIDLKENFCRVLRYALISVLCFWFFFTYVENLVNLARINREENERIEILEKAAESGNIDDVVVPKYRPEWDNPYTTAYKNDMEDDAFYWINTFYAEYHGINGVYAVPRDEWEENYAPDGHAH